MQSEVQYKREKEVKRGPHMCQWMERVKRMILDSEETDERIVTNGKRRVNSSKGEEAS